MLKLFRRFAGLGGVCGPSQHSISHNMHPPVYIRHQSVPLRTAQRSRLTVAVDLCARRPGNRHPSVRDVALHPALCTPRSHAHDAPRVEDDLVRSDSGSGGHSTPALRRCIEIQYERSQLLHSGNYGYQEIRLVGRRGRSAVLRRTTIVSSRHQQVNRLAI